MQKKTSQHILNSSANLLGFCLIVITSFHINNRSATSIIDEFTSIVAFLLIVSCLFSFFSIRTASTKAEQILETVADYLFIASLIGILLIVLLISLNYIQ